MAFNKRKHTARRCIHISLNEAGSMNLSSTSPSNSLAVMSYRLRPHWQSRRIFPFSLKLFSPSFNLFIFSRNRIRRAVFCRVNGASCKRLHFGRIQSCHVVHSLTKYYNVFRFLEPIIFLERITLMQIIFQLCWNKTLLLVIILSGNADTCHWKQRSF
jgi:hypothetical protein